jgi:pimeloyl-ACP methyl ester carboxylesterase
MGGLAVQLLLAALAALAVFFLLGWAHLRFWVRRLTLPLDYAVRLVLLTEDGSRIELRRVPIPADAEIAVLPPLLLVHGVAANHRNNDLHPDYSLARHLAALGRDVWLLTLRSGLGHRTRAEAARVRFAAMVKHDLPLAVTEVLGRTGSEQLDYVGFSMGGMLIYAALGRTVPASRVRRVVVVGSPGRVTAPALLLPLLKRVPRWLVPRSPFRLGAHGVAFASEWFGTPLHRILVNPRNVPAGLTRATLVNMVEDIPAPLNADFLEWAVRDGSIRVDGEPVLDGLAEVDVPALFFAGNADKLAPVAAVEAAFDAWGKGREGVVKRLVVLGKDHGYRADYGHGDMAMGAHARAELFEPIARFLGPEDEGEERAAESGEEAVGEVMRREAVG